MNIKLVFLILLLFMLFFCKGQGKQTVKKCDSEVITATKEKLDSLSETDVLKFFSVFDSRCSTDAEFSEYSNEVLFLVLEKQPELFISVIEKYSCLSKDYILEVIKHPVNDLIKIERIKFEVLKVKTKSKVKDEIIRCLSDIE